MDKGMLEFGFQVLQFIVTGVVGIYVYLTRKDTVTNERIGKLEAHIEEKIDDHSARLAHLETEVRAAPSHADIVKLYDKLNEFNAQLNHLTGEFKGANRTLNLIHETLMERK